MAYPHSLALLSPAMWELYRDLRLSSLLDSPDAFGGTYALEAARPPDVWQSRLAAAATSGLDLPLLARVGELPAGLCWAKRDAAYLSVVNVYQMWVAPECRGVGIGGGAAGALHGLGPNHRCGGDSPWGHDCGQPGSPSLHSARLLAGGRAAASS